MFTDHRTYWRKDQATGAVELNECPSRGRCHCGYCAVCGWQKHMAVHGGIVGEPKNGRPYGHVFEAEKVGVTEEGKP